MLLDKIRGRIARALCIEKAQVTLTPPPHGQSADVSTNVAFIVGREKVNTIAKMIGAFDEIKSASVAGTGFINIVFEDKALQEEIKWYSKNNWKGDLLKGKKIAIEYTDPNPFKAFHLGHLMTNTIGESLSRIGEALGAKVFRLNYQGDVGLHTAKAVWALQKQNPSVIDVVSLGKAYVYGAKQYEESNVARDEIRTVNKSLYAKDDTSLQEIYNKGKKASLDSFEEMYAKLGTKFDGYFFESEVAKQGADEVHKATGTVFEDDDGSIIYSKDKNGIHTRVFINKEGLPTYEAKEIGLALAKEKKFRPDKSIIVTANEIRDYVRVVFSAIKEIHPDIARKTRHVLHGFLRLKDGKMSSRTGDVVIASDVIEEISNRVKDKAKEQVDAQAIAISTLKYSILRQSAGKDIIFSLDKEISFEGDSGPYLLYSLVRILSILRRAPKTHFFSRKPDAYLQRDIACLLLFFPDTVRTSWESGSAHHIATFLTSFVSVWNAWYAQERILLQEDVHSRIMTVKAIQSVLDQGIYLLGIQKVEKM